MTGRSLLAISLVFLLFGCEKHAPQEKETHAEIIKGRDEGPSLARQPLYRISVPNDWKRIDPSDSESLQDTKKALCEFLIEEEGQRVRITVHNFPVRAKEGKIPPLAQIERWKRQFETAPSLQTQVAQSFSGFVGFLYEGSGKIEGEDAAVMGWALQIGPEHERVLSRPKFPKQMLADITIKAKGQPDRMRKHRTEIISFARSFELLEEIPRE